MTSTQLYAGLRWLFAFASSDVLPPTTVIADHFGMNHDQLADAMNIFATAGAISTQLDTDGAVIAIRQPGWALSTRNPVIRAIVIELARRIDTGWYLWTGLDGVAYSRQFPTAEAIAGQFHVDSLVASQAIAHLHRLGYLWAASLIPRRLIGVETKCLLVLWGDHYAVADLSDLREVIRHAATARRRPTPRIATDSTHHAC